MKNKINPTLCIIIREHTTKIEKCNSPLIYCVGLTKHNKKIEDPIYTVVNLVISLKRQYGQK